MFYLVSQIWLHLILAFALGGAVVWWSMRGSLARSESALEESRGAQEELRAALARGDAQLIAARADLQHAGEELTFRTDELALRRAEWPERMVGGPTPASRTPRPGSRLQEQLVLDRKPAEVQPDDLTRIKGVGRVLAGRLNEMGIHTFGEIAAWSPHDIERIQASLPRFPGRVRRDDWMSQAAVLDQTTHSAAHQEPHA